MVTVKWTFLLFIVIETVFSCGIGQEFDDWEDSDEEILKYAESDITVPCDENTKICEETGGKCFRVDEKNLQCRCPKGTTLEENFGCTDKDCDEGRCRNSTCKCCPGYGINRRNECQRCYCGESGNCTFSKINNSRQCLCPPGYGFEGKCKKCDCGKDFNCTFSGFWQVKKTCDCPTGYTESSGICKADCKSNPCKFNGKCIVSKDTIVCVCTDLYIGQFCEIKNPCLSNNPCKNGGNCTVLDDKAKCQCHDKYTGEFCDKEKCSTIKCFNGGICEIKNSKAVCICPEKYTGESCEIELSTEKFLPSTTTIATMPTESTTSSTIINTSEFETTASITSKISTKKFVPSTTAITRMSTESTTSSKTINSSEDESTASTTSKISTEKIVSAIPITTIFRESTTTPSTITSKDETTGTTASRAFEMWIQVMKQFRMKDSESSMNFSFRYKSNHM